MIGYTIGYTIKQQWGMLWSNNGAYHEAAMGLWGSNRAYHRVIIGDTIGQQ